MSYTDTFRTDRYTGGPFQTIIFSFREVLDMLQKTQSWKTQIFLFIEMLFGSILMAASFGLIIIPQEFSAGGITGLARVLQSVLPVNLSLLVFFFNMFLLLAGFLFIGKEFVAKTIAVSVLFPLFLEFFSVFSVNSLKKDALVSVLIAGCMLGAGAGLIIRSGASGGGFDTLAIILHKKFGLPVAIIMNFCDVAVILLQIVGHPVLKSIYGIITITLSAYIVKQVITLKKHESNCFCHSLLQTAADKTGDTVHR